MRVRGDRVTQVGTLEEMDREPGETIRDFPDAVLMPGLINAHCHLELGMARSQLPRGEPFPMWVSRLRKALDGAKPDQYRQAARLGVLECLKNGTTTIVDVGNTGESMPELASLPIRSYPYLEVIGLDPKAAPERFRQAGERLAAAPESTELYRPGMTCHAPYSCSVDLMRKIGGDEGSRRGPFTMHVAESAEETAMFREGRGALFDFCSRIFPDLKLDGNRSPVQFLGSHGLIPRGSLFVHCNHADAEDIRILADTETSVVHCPRSKAFFGHGGFAAGLMRKAGVNLCLGTDSLASNEGLSLFDEMAELRRNHPEIPCRDILAMATLNGAKALGRTGELGCLQAGSKADFIAISLRHHPEYDLYEEIVCEAHEVLLVSVAGEEVVS
jgi:cytosine/adenosine deaminase-related metal-dependent hydrolase